MYETIKVNVNSKASMTLEVSERKCICNCLQLSVDKIHSFGINVRIKVAVIAEKYVFEEIKIR